jgi:hypothetical protein
LIVMVTEGLNGELEEHGSARPVDARNKEAIDMFEKFASQLEGEILVRYIPGGERALARSIVREMATYGLPRGSRDISDVKPLPDETNVSQIQLPNTLSPCCRLHNLVGALPPPNRPQPLRRTSHSRLAQRPGRLPACLGLASEQFRRTSANSTYIRVTNVLDDVRGGESAEFPGCARWE